MKRNEIIIKGARENNLKNIDINIPKDQLVVITGPSGSGKSTLAFDTIYAEGKRRYIESLSSYARQFLGGSEKPDVDSIDVLSPAISIDQKTGSNNPRSTVGTITEIADYLRLLFARIGTPYCPKHNIEIKAKSAEVIKADILNTYLGEKVEILAHSLEKEKGTHQKFLEQLLKDGYIRVYIDNQLYDLSEEIENIKLEKNKKHDIFPVIDRFKLKQEDSSRLLNSIEEALKLGNGQLLIKHNDKYQLVSSNYSCPKCDFTVPKLEPRLFSFNAPMGACPNCHGLGTLKEPDVNLIIPNPDLSLNEECITANGFRYGTYYFRQIELVCESFGIDMDKPFKQLTKKQQDMILYGTTKPILLVDSFGGKEYARDFIYEGVCNNVKRRFLETSSERQRRSLESLMSETSCPVCHGSRLNETALAIKIGGLNIHEVSNLSIKDGYQFFNKLKLTKAQQTIGQMVFSEIKARYEFLINVGLDYLNLTRSATTLSGGEAQRIRLATQIGSKLTGVLYVLDEPSIGLHQRDNDRLINTLKSMRDLGNTLIVVEHDEDTMLAADYLIDMGPGSGTYGGEVVAQGSPAQVMKNSKSITGKYLAHKEEISVPQQRREQNQGYIEIKNASANNLNNIDVNIPKNNLVCITGVSGSGKSSLINGVLYKHLYNHFNPETKVSVDPKTKVKNIDNFKKVIQIDQKPIGRTPRSNPATYIGVFDDIRDLFASLPESKARGYLKGRFSFNVKGGRCEACEGDGIKKIEMNFLPDVYITCETCHGSRYNEDVLEIKYNGKNISDVLNMEISEALTFFENIPTIKRKLQTLVEVGLGYLQLGTPATVLSGGEAQRVKLAKELTKVTTGDTIYILDEPTTGLHACDIKRLIEVLQRLVDKGNTMIIIEHNLDLIKVSDYIIDLGPEGGDGGGNIVATGTPEAVVKVKGSYTAKYLKPYLKNKK